MNIERKPRIPVNGNAAVPGLMTPILISVSEFSDALKKQRNSPMSMDVISLKKLIESNQEELLRGTLSAYRAALEAMGNSGVQACPPLGTQLQLGLWNLQHQLADEATPGLVRETEERVAAELSQWVEKSAGYYRGKTEEFKEIMMIMARAAEAVGDRDQRYSSR